MRSSVRSGRPYGAEDRVEVISHRLGIVREPRRRGRPPREKMLRHRNSLRQATSRPRSASSWTMSCLPLPRTMT